MKNKILKSEKYKGYDIQFIKTLNTNPHSKYKEQVSYIIMNGDKRVDTGVGYDKKGALMWAKDYIDSISKTNSYTDDIDFSDPLERANFETGLRKREDGGWE